MVVETATSVENSGGEKTVTGHTMVFRVRSQNRVLFVVCGRAIDPLKEKLYEYIGCKMVEMLLGRNKLCGCDVYFDEEGFTKPVNFLASSLLGKNFRGVVCITKEEEDDY